MPDFENDTEGNILQEPMSIGELLSTGQHFEISSNSNNIDGMQYDYFDDFGLGSSDDEAPEIDSQLLISPWQETFDKLRPNMIKINDLIFKRVVHVGVKNSILVPDKSRVSIQYTSYAENTTKTFDSTYLRGRPHTFYTGNNEILTGIEEAVRTMQLDEESQFIISYELLYGEIGCPPRIPPKTDYLFVIKVLRFEEVGDINAMNQVTKEDRYKFHIVFPKVKDIHKKGIDFFKLKNYQSALKAFHSGINNLISCRLSNESEEKEYTDFLMKLYTNCATIYSILDQPAKVCSMCNEMRSISKNLFNLNAKALYREGKAYSDLGDFERARRKLIQAKRLNTVNEDINAELEKLNTRKSQYLKNNKEICSRAFGLLNINEKQNKDSENDLFQEDMRETLESFKNNESLEEIQLPDGLSANEIECVETLVKKMDLKLTLTTLNKKKIITKIK